MNFKSTLKDITPPFFWKWLRKKLIENDRNKKGYDKRRWWYGEDLKGDNSRFNEIFNFIPYIGLNLSSFLGFQSDTNYGENGSGEYGVGGPETFVECYGITPNLGFFKSSGFLKGYGFSIENLKLECDNDHNRSMTEGYEADFDIIQYRIDHRIFF